MTSISGATFSSTVTAFNDADRLTSEAIGRDLCLVEWPMTRYDVDQHQDCLKQDEDGRKRRGCSTSRKKTGRARSLDVAITCRLHDTVTMSY